MRIALLAPLWKTVPPKMYGGTELIASLLSDELVKLGHQVTLYACGGSKTKAKLVEVIDKPLFDEIGGFRFDSVPFQDVMEIKMAFDDVIAGKFDIVHNHMGINVAAFGNLLPIPMITTNHSSVPPDFEPIARLAKNENYISISDSQRIMSPYLNYIDTVYHGIETSDFEFNSNPDDYLLFLATFSNSKGADRAIKIAQKTGKKLIMAGDIKDNSFFDKKIKPFIDSKQITYFGEVDFATKSKLMKNAKAYLFPIRWSEAFGLTVVEALASGTPVIAYRNGSMPEIIDDNKTGFLVDNIDQAVKAVNKINTISRSECRRQAVKRFDVSVMAKNYIKIYERLVK